MWFLKEPQNNVIFPNVLNRENFIICQTQIVPLSIQGMQIHATDSEDYVT